MLYEKYSGKTEGQMMEEKKDPLSDCLPNEKTDFREASSLDHEDETAPLKAEFAYKGTDKGVAK